MTACCDLPACRCRKAVDVYKVVTQSQDSESPVCFLVSGQKAVDKQYPETRRHKRDGSVHGDTTAAQHLSPSVEQLLAIHLLLDSMLICGGQA